MCNRTYMQCNNVHGIYSTIISSSFRCTVMTESFGAEMFCKKYYFVTHTQHQACMLSQNMKFLCLSVYTVFYIRWLIYFENTIRQRFLGYHFLVVHQALIWLGTLHPQEFSSWFPFNCGLKVSLSVYYFIINDSLL